MERLLVLLFSVTLLIATAAPRGASEECNFSGGICTTVETAVKKSTSCLFSGCSEKNETEEQDSGCSMPACCVSGPCCCLCLVPEQPQICGRPVLIQEKRVKPGYYQGFYPQEVDLSIWKPPAPSPRGALPLQTSQTSAAKPAGTGGFRFRRLNPPVHSL